MCVFRSALLFSFSEITDTAAQTTEIYLSRVRVHVHESHAEFLGKVCHDFQMQMYRSTQEIHSKSR